MTKLELAYSWPELVRQTGAICEEHGAIHRVGEAIHILGTLIEEAAYCPKGNEPTSGLVTQNPFRTRSGPILEGMLTADQAAEAVKKFHFSWDVTEAAKPMAAKLSLMVGQTGLNAEWMNGTGISAMLWLLPREGSDLDKAPLDERIQKVLKSFDKRCQLGTICEGVKVNTSDEAIRRSQKEIVSWLGANQDTIAPETAAAIRLELDKLQRAYDEITAWKEYAQGYFQQIERNTVKIDTDNGRPLA